MDVQFAFAAGFEAFLGAGFAGFFAIDFFTGFALFFAVLKGFNQRAARAFRQEIEAIDASAKPR